MSEENAFFLFSFLFVPSLFRSLPEIIHEMDMHERTESCLTESSGLDCG